MDLVFLPQRCKYTLWSSAAVPRTVSRRPELQQVLSAFLLANVSPTSPKHTSTGCSCPGSLVCEGLTPGSRQTGQRCGREISGYEGYEMPSSHFGFGRWEGMVL